MTTNSLDLAAILDRAERTYAFIGEDPCTTTQLLPADVRQHFNYDVPALIGAVQRLERELADTKDLCVQAVGELAERDGYVLTALGRSATDRDRSVPRG